MLVEELTDIDADIWDAHLQDENSTRPVLNTTQLQTLPPTTSDSDSHTYICNVEVHSEPCIAGENEMTLDSTVQRRVSQLLQPSQHTSAIDDEDVSTQALDISPSDITFPSYHSAQSTSVPSLTSHISFHTPDEATITHDTSSVMSCRGDLAQEIVDLVQSDKFAEDTTAAGVLRCGSSQLSLLFNNSSTHNNSGYYADTEQCTPIRVGGLSSSTPTTIGTVSARSGQNEPQQIVIPLSELDDYFGSSIIWEEDWDQELQTML